MFLIIEVTLQRRCGNVLNGDNNACVLVCSHSISMLHSPKQANMGHCPNIYISKPNIYLTGDFYCIMR